MKKVSEKQLSTEYSDKEINELAEWLEELTLKEAFFLKESYEGYLKKRLMHEVDKHVH